MNTTDYNNLVLDHLSDSNTYEFKGKFNNNWVTAMCKLKLSPLVSNPIIKQLNDQSIKYLNEKREYKLPFFHILAKIHKSPLKGRPIVGATNWITTPVSILLDILLQKIVIQFSTILKNTYQLLQELKNVKMTSEDRLVTLDISSLYTNINIKVLETSLSDPLLKLLFKFICDNNYFQYGDLLFKQKRGIAMGTNAAVNLANIYLARFYDPNIVKNKKVKFFKRYIDDIFIIYNNHEDTLTSDLEIWNKLIRDIKITYEFNDKTINFLDVTIFQKEDGSLGYKTFQKPINKYLYLPPFSYHTKHTIKGFITGEILRYKKTNSDNLDLTLILSQFKFRLLERGYSKFFLNKIFKSQTTNSSKEKEKRKKLLPFVIRYTNKQTAQEIKNIINEFKMNFTKLNHSHKIQTTFECSKKIGLFLLNSNLTTDQIHLVTPYLAREFTNNSNQSHLQDSPQARTFTRNPLLARTSNLKNNNIITKKRPIINLYEAPSTFEDITQSTPFPKKRKNNQL